MTSIRAFIVVSIICVFATFSVAAGPPSAQRTNVLFLNLLPLLNLLPR